MKIILLLSILFGLEILHRKRLININSNIGHNLAKKHLEDEFGVDTDKKEN